MRMLVALVLTLWSVAAPLAAQELSALARVRPELSSITEAPSGAIEFSLALTQPVPWRVRLLADPPRLLIDAREIDFSPLDQVIMPDALRAALRAGVFRPGWSRLVLALDAPRIVSQSEMQTEGGAILRLRLEPASADAFSLRAHQPEPAEWTPPKAADSPAPSGPHKGPLVVMLDPGHGGLDPGAERDGQSEADLMLSFARDLKEIMLRDGRFKVVMTREEDVFVPLETRISLARAAGADVFVSLHADALAEGEAEGTTLYTLADEASDAAAEALAERHDRDDLLAGVDLSGQDDVVAQVLMDMARTETAPRVERLAKALEEAILGAGLDMYKKPHQEAGFSVLKSPDIPSILVEIGFMSSTRDHARLIDPKWRKIMVQALADGLLAWSAEDAALRRSKGD